MQRDHVFFFIALCLMACNNQSEKEKPSTEIFVSSLYKMDMLEKIFTNDNWMKVEGTDTSYYYFSRIPLITRVYHYRISKGDSVNTTISEIKFQNDSLAWQFDDTTNLLLSGINEKESKWDRRDTSRLASSFMVFEKNDDRHINLSIAGKEQFLLTKTLPFSAFLIRSRYDFLHGTRFAFSDTVFNVRKKK
jgi:hypothetical protein